MRMDRSTRETTSTAEPKALSFAFDVHIRTGPNSHRELAPGPAPAPRPLPPGRIPRISRLMAIALHFDQAIKAGEVRDFRELARLGKVSCARVSQIMNLLLLAPDLQEALLGLPRLTRGREPVTERQLRAVVAIVDWREQREVWEGLGLGPR